MNKYFKIPTLEEFDINEGGFQNPFDHNEKIVKTRHLADRGAPLIKRANTFNASRLEVSKRGASYYITAKSQFARGEIVEVCPVILLGSEAIAIDSLRDIVFELDKAADQWALVLGYGSLYGHSDDPNVEYAYNKKHKQMIFMTKRDVKMGEELCINYGSDFWVQRKDFGTMAQMDDVDSTVTKLMPKEIQESGNFGASGPADMARNTTFNEPNAAGNPANTGKALMGGGQS